MRPQDESPQTPLQRCVEPERSSVMASPVFWIAALGSLAFWVLVGYLVLG